MRRTRGAVNVPIALASLLVSIMLWIVVFPQSQGRKPQTFYVPLRQYNLDDTKWVVDKIPETIIVSANVTDKEFEALSSKPIRAEVDLSSPSTGTRSYHVSIYPTDLERIIKQKDLTATVTVERLQSRMLPVVPVSSGKLKDERFNVTSLVAQTKSVTIDGPTTAVRKVVSIQALVDLSLVEVSAPVAVPTLLDAVDSDGHVVPQVNIHPSSLMVTPKLSAVTGSRTVFIDAVFSGRMPAGFEVKSYTVTPNETLVSGADTDIGSLTKLTTVPIDISNLTASTTVTAKLDLSRASFDSAVKSVQVRLVVGHITGDTPNGGLGATNPPGGTGSPLNGSSAGQ